MSQQHIAHPDSDPLPPKEIAYRLRDAMRWLSNIMNPAHPDAAIYAQARSGGTQEEAWRDLQLWLKGTVIGRPRATEVYNVEQLEKMHMVGVYTNEPAPTEIRE